MPDENKSKTPNIEGSTTDILVKDTVDISLPKKKKGGDAFFRRNLPDGSVRKTPLLKRKGSETEDDFIKRMTELGYLGPEKPGGHWKPESQDYHAGLAEGCRLCTPGGGKGTRNTKSKSFNGAFRNVSITKIGNKITSNGGMRVTLYLDCDKDDFPTNTAMIRVSFRKTPEATSPVKHQPKDAPQDPKPSEVSTEKQDTEVLDVPATPKDEVGVPKRDGSGKGERANQGRGGCTTTKVSPEDPKTEEVDGLKATAKRKKSRRKR